jgi:hypothetical protein
MSVPLNRPISNNKQNIKTKGKQIPKKKKTLKCKKGNSHRFTRGGGDKVKSINILVRTKQLFFQ